MSVRKGSNIIAIGNIQVDGDTTSFNSNHSLQAIGTKNKNTESSVVGVYDWVGTMDEYTEQNVAVLHPDWICFITDDEEMDIDNYYTKTATDDRFAHRDADNFTQAGTTYLSGLGMPSNTDVEDITVLASSQQYTAPANGWFIALGTAPSSGNSYLLLVVNNTTLYEKRQIIRTGNFAGPCGIMMPVLAGEEVGFAYSMTNIKLRFFYAEGNSTNS